MLVFGMLDLAIVLFRKHVVSEGARQGARIAIVHGYLAPNSSTANAWGPTPPYCPPLPAQSLYSGATSYEVGADQADDEFAGAIRPYLAGLDPSTVTLGIAWPDGNNEPGNRVTVTVSVPYQHIVPFVFDRAPITLGASSTMTIVH